MLWTLLAYCHTPPILRPLTPSNQTTKESDADCQYALLEVADTLRPDAHLLLACCVYSDYGWKVTAASRR